MSRDVSVSSPIGAPCPEGKPSVSSALQARLQSTFSAAVLAAVALGACLSLPAFAEEGAASVNDAPAGDVSATQQEAAPDLRMAIDVSGSMKHNDPGNLRASALDLLVTLLPERSRAGLWSFGERVQPLLALGPVNGDWKRSARGLEGRLDDYEQYTDLESGLRAAAKGAQSGIEGDSPRQVILLSDGMVDLRNPSSVKAAQDSASRQRIIDELTPKLAAHDITVHTVALSRNADIDLLQQIADGTGGLATVAETPEDLLRAFLAALDRIVPGEQVPLQDKRFTIDTSVDEFTALVFHDPEADAPVLIGPDGKRYSRTPSAGEEGLPEGVRWEHQPRYDLITVTDPEAGQWRIEGQVGADSRITVVSDLALVSRPLPATLYRGFDYSLEATLAERARDVSDASFLATLDGNARLVPANDPSMQGNGESEGQSQDVDTNAATDSAVDATRDALDVDSASVTTAQQRGLERDGAHFNVEMPAPQVLGGARLTVTVWGQHEGESFSRQLSQRTSVVDPLMVEPAKGNPPSELTVSARYPLLNTANTQVSATLRGETLTVTEQGERQWRIELPTLEKDVSADVQITAKVDLNGDTRVIDLAPFTLNERAARRAANLDRTPIEGQSFGEVEGLDQAGADEKEDLNQLLMEGHLPIDKVPALIRQWFDGASDFAQREARSPQSRMIAYAVAGVIGLLVLIMLVRRMTRKPQRREEPHV